MHKLVLATVNMHNKFEVPIPKTAQPYNLHSGVICDFGVL